MPLPDPAMTPGATFAGVTAAQVCVPGWSSAHRDVTTTERYDVFVAYGIPYSQHSAYEVDHLISLELGGDNEEANLWPEPQTENDSTGPDKDALENHLHALVCDHQLALPTAQQAIAGNWVAAWYRYETVPVTPPTTVPPPPPPPTTTVPPPPPTTTTVPPPPPSSAPTDQGVVHPGAFCAPEGATGHTDLGTPMVCGPASDGRNRWHHA